MSLTRRIFLCSLAATLAALPLQAEHTAWRQATPRELASLLPARAPVEREHIETEMRTASGIINGRGRCIAGVVLLTAGYSADGKYSHYLLVQAPVKVAGLQLKPGSYLLGYSHSGLAESLTVRIHEAATGQQIGAVDAHLLAGIRGITSLRIWPPTEKSVIQLGRFALPYELEE